MLIRIRKNSGRRSVFPILLFVATFATIYDICAVALDNSGRGNVPLKYILHAGYLVLRNLITPMFCYYVVSVTDTWHSFNKKKQQLILFWLPFSIVAVLALISPFTHTIFYINSNDAYTRGPLFAVLYLSAIFYTVFAVAYAIKYTNALSMEYFVPLMSIAPFQAIAVIVQLIFPNILCEMVTTALSLLLVMLTIEKPAEKFEITTGLLKRNVFMDMLIQSGIVKKPYCIVLINVTNYSAISSYMSFSNMEALNVSIRRRLEVIKSHLHVSPEMYNLENGLFAVVLYGKDIPYGARYASHVLETFRHEYSTNGISVSALPNVCIINVPDDTYKIEELRLITKDFRNKKYTGELFLASNFMKSKDYSVVANMDSILSSAIENNAFEVYYQPIFSNSDNRFNSAEALIRLNTKEYGFIRPDIFIPIAEESGAIHQIGMIVLEKVCQFIASETFSLLNLDYIEVNLSVVQCLDKNIVSKITDMCKKYGVKPSQINLEITETSSTLAQKNLISNIETLHKEGFSFSLDDFGTGYSNMVRIASLPLHIVKLDKSFTWTENNKDLKLILENTIGMVKKMGMKIVVEGVETEEMLKRFVTLKCEYIQGYYFSKPLPEYDFINYMIDHRESLSQV